MGQIHAPISSSGSAVALDASCRGIWRSVSAPVLGETRLLQPLEDLG